MSYFHKKNSRVFPFQNSLTKSAILKLNLNPRNVHQQELTDSKLYQGLRVCLSILKAYLAHLPLSGGQLYPEALSGALEEMERTTGFCEELGFPCQEFDTDLRRMRKALLKEMGMTKKEEKPAPKKEETKMNSKNIDLINNLARE